VAIVSLGSLKREFAGEDLFTIELEPRGHFNGHPIEGEVFGVYSSNRNVFHGHMEFEDHPGIGNGLLFISSCSIVCSGCCMNAWPLQDAVNLMSLVDEQYGVEIDYTALRDPGAVIGTGQQKVKAFVDRSDPSLIQVKGSVEIEAEGIGTDPAIGRIMASSPGYTEFLRQVGKGAVEGILGYPYLAESAKGETWPSSHVYSVRRYSYDSARSLPFAEIRSYHLQDLVAKVVNGRRVIDFYCDAYYMPLGITASELLTLGAGPRLASAPSV
jgi:hypothetical protein